MSDTLTFRAFFLERMREATESRAGAQRDRAVRKLVEALAPALFPSTVRQLTSWGSIASIRLDADFATYNLDLDAECFRLLGCSLTGDTPSGIPALVCAMFWLLPHDSTQARYAIDVLKERLQDRVPYAEVADRRRHREIDRRCLTVAWDRLKQRHRHAFEDGDHRAVAEYITPDAERST